MSFFSHSKACPVSLLTGTPNSNSRTFKMWGTLDATDAHLLIGSGDVFSTFLCWHSHAHGLQRHTGQA